MRRPSNDHKENDLFEKKIQFSSALTDEADDPHQHRTHLNRYVSHLQILEHPFTVLAIDTPRRPPEDVHFVNPADGTPQTFINTQY